MMLHLKRVFCAAVALAASALATLPAAAADPVRIGEINSYTGLPAFTIPYRQGWELAVEEINAKGGVLGGRMLEVISRDDAGKPDDAVRVANELVSNEKVDILAGTYFSHIGLAVSDYALRSKKVFVAAEPLTDAITWDKGNRYTFRLRPSTYMQAAMLVEQAAALPAKRWATVAPNYEYGQSAVAVFKQLLKAKRPDVEFVGEQWPAQGKIDAGSTVQALAASQPEAIFNVTFGADLAKFVREGTTRGVFDGVSVVSLLTGEPEYLDPLKGEAPEGWIVTGYPWDQIDSPAHKAVPGCLSEPLQGLSPAGLGRRLHDLQGHRRRSRKGRFDRFREGRRRLQGPQGGKPVRRDRVPRHRPSGDHGRLCRQDRGEGRQGQR